MPASGRCASVRAGMSTKFTPPRRPLAHLQEAVRDLAVAISRMWIERVTLWEYASRGQREIDELKAGVSAGSWGEQPATRSGLREIYQLCLRWLTGTFDGWKMTIPPVGQGPARAADRTGWYKTREKYSCRSCNARGANSGLNRC